MVRGQGKLRQSSPMTHTGFATLIYFVTMRRDGGGALRSAGESQK
jgi:hypothetical protein